MRNGLWLTAMFTFLTVAICAESAVDGEIPPEEAEMPRQVISLPMVPLTNEVILVEPEEPPKWTEEEITVLAKMLWGEARGVKSDAEKAACVWCVLNRVDRGYGPIVEVVTAPYQFVGYDIDNPIDDQIKTLCEDVLTRWFSEKKGEADVGRVLPSDYLWFSGDGERNHFRNAYRGGEKWDWSLTNPYES